VAGARRPPRACRAAALPPGLRTPTLAIGRLPLVTLGTSLMADHPRHTVVTSTSIYSAMTPHSHENIVMGSQGWDNTILGPSCSVLHILVHIQPTLVTPIGSLGSLGSLAWPTA
jgi:hypothetical protein